MLNKEELRKQVIQYFRSVGSGENIVQCIKEALFLHDRFSPVVLFEVYLLFSIDYPKASKGCRQPTSETT